MDVFRVVSPGPFTTVQDRGRYSFIDRGVPPSGALDLFAYDIANLLVGNPAGTAVLEITMMGPTLEALGEADVALAGADVAVTVNRQPVPMWQTVPVKKATSSGSARRKAAVVLTSRSRAASTCPSLWAAGPPA